MEETFVPKMWNTAETIFIVNKSVLISGPIIPKMANFQISLEEWQPNKESKNITVLI